MNDSLGSDYFVIDHYAEAVIYNAAGFIKRNTDYISNDLKQFISCSSRTLLQKLFDVEPNLDRKKTVCTVFQRAMSQLMDTLNDHPCYFIKCIKPNNNQIKFLLDEKQLFRQLKTGGIKPVLEIMKKGYPFRLDYDAIYKKFEKFLIDFHPNSFSTRKFCELVLNYVTIKPNQYKFGKTKIFFKHGAFNQLENQFRKLTLNQAFKQFYSDLIKHHYLVQIFSIKYYCEFIHKIQKILIISRQKNMAKLVQAQYDLVFYPHRKHVAALKIQKWFQSCGIIRLTFIKKLKSVVFLQRIFSTIYLSRKLQKVIKKLEIKYYAKKLLFYLKIYKHRKNHHATVIQKCFKNSNTYKKWIFISNLRQYLFTIRIQNFIRRKLFIKTSENSVSNQMFDDIDDKENTIPSFKTHIDANLNLFVNYSGNKSGFSNADKSKEKYKLALPRIKSPMALFKSALKDKNSSNLFEARNEYLNVISCDTANTKSQSKSQKKFIIDRKTDQHPILTRNAFLTKKINQEQIKNVPINSDQILSAQKQPNSDGLSSLNRNRIHNENSLLDKFDQEINNNFNLEQSLLMPSRIINSAFQNVSDDLCLNSSLERSTALKINTPSNKMTLKEKIERKNSGNSCIVSKSAQKNKYINKDSSSINGAFRTSSNFFIHSTNHNPSKKRNNDDLPDVSPVKLPVDAETQVSEFEKTTDESSIIFNCENNQRISVGEILLSNTRKSILETSLSVNSKNSSTIINRLIYDDSNKNTNKELNSSVLFDNSTLNGRDAVYNEKDEEIMFSTPNVIKNLAHEYQGSNSWVSNRNRTNLRNTRATIEVWRAMDNDEKMIIETPLAKFADTPLFGGSNKRTISIKDSTQNTKKQKSDQKIDFNWITDNINTMEDQLTEINNENFNLNSENKKADSELKNSLYQSKKAKAEIPASSVSPNHSKSSIINNSIIEFGRIDDSTTTDQKILHHEFEKINEAQLLQDDSTKGNLNYMGSKSSVINKKYKVKKFKCKLDENGILRLQPT